MEPDCRHGHAIADRIGADFDDDHHPCRLYRRRRRGLKHEHIWPGGRAGSLRFVTVLVGMTLLLLASISVSVWLWALCLLGLGVFDEAETSVYFALVSFTTLGLGDIVLEKQWRILSGLMAANGLLIFGLTTAVLVDFLAHLRRR